MAPAARPGKMCIRDRGKMKQFATYFTHGVRNGSKLRVEIYKATQAPEILNLVDAFFERELAELPAGVSA